MPDAPAIRESYAECRRIARRAASNFYYAFFLLPRPKRDALCALYAFMRRVDDVSDSSGEVKEKRQQLAARRAEFDAALGGEPGGDRVLPALADAIRRFSIPPRYLHDLISGAEMDLTITVYPTFDRLREYCYRVAGTVGLCCVHVFGFDPSAADAPNRAEKLGIAFQLTNILRDVRRDLSLGRVYLPLEDLDRFGCKLTDLSAKRPSPAVVKLLGFEAERAWGFYTEGAELLSLVHADSRPALAGLVRIYSSLLRKIEARGFDVFSPRPVRLSTAAKAWKLISARLRGSSQEHVLERMRRQIG